MVPPLPDAQTLALFAVDAVDAVETLALVAAVRLTAASDSVTVSEASAPTCTVTAPLAPAVPSNSPTPLNFEFVRIDVIWLVSCVTSACRLVRSPAE